MKELMSKDRMLHWATPDINAEDAKAVSETLEANWISQGPKTSFFEEEIRVLAGRRCAVAVSNGTVALDLALAALGIKEGDRVIVPAMTYAASVSTIIRQRAIPVYADIDETGNIDPLDVEKKITDAALITLIDYGGNPANHEAILEVAKWNKKPVLLDGAQSLGTKLRINDKLVPTLSLHEIATMSFHTAKIITTGEGGMILTDNDFYELNCRVIRNQGERGVKYVHELLGTNARLTDMQAALGLSQLIRLDMFLAHRRWLATKYTEKLDRSMFDFPAFDKFGMSSFFLFPILIDGSDRDRIAHELRRPENSKRRPIETRICYPMPVYSQPAFATRGFYERSCEKAEYFTNHVLNLPMSYRMTEDDVDDVVNALHEVMFNVR